MEPLLISIGGALGAVCRYAIGEWSPQTTFPWTTLLVNTFGSLLLGGLLASAVTTDLMLLLGIGFCGAFTTFSSFSVQVISLSEQGEYVLACVHALGNLILSLLAFGGGWLVISW